MRPLTPLAMSRKARNAQIVSLTAFFGLLLLLTGWYAWLAPSRLFPVSLVLLVMVTPLLLPLRGLLHGKPYTYAWTSLLALLYFAHGVVEAYVNPAERLYAAAEVLLALILFLAAVLYARWRSRELKQDEGS